MLQELDLHCGELCKKKSPSLLRPNQYPDMVNFDWKAVLLEMSKRCPLLLDVMASSVGLSLRNKPDVIHAIGLCYSILTQKRNHDLRLIQRIDTILLSEGKAKKQVS